jgi:hypothetical protein
MFWSCLLCDGGKCVEKLLMRLTTLLTTLWIGEVWAIWEEGSKQVGQVAGKAAGCQGLLKIAEPHGDIALRWERFVEKAGDLAALFIAAVSQCDLTSNAT